MSLSLKNHKLKLNFSQMIALSFLFLIVLGSLLLALPISARNGHSCGPMIALFTTTSALCVTGLSLVDIFSTFNFFGQCVLLVLMELGGLGFMSLISVLFYLTNHKNTIQSLSLIAESLGSNEIKHISRIQKRLLVGSFLFESIGAILLFFEFLPKYGVLQSIWFGIFHSVSAFCNAGFDLLGITSPGSSLTTLQHNPLSLTTIALLIVIGGIGFLVWDDIATNKKPRLWSVNTKLVLIMTSVLLFVGTVLFFLFEHQNSATFASLSLPEQIANAFFQSSTTRTAGFAGVDQASLTDRSIALTTLFMIVGGSAGSTAGGIKTVTFFILLKAVIANAKGKRYVTVMNRSLSHEQVAYAFTVAGSFLILSIFGAFFINLTSDISFVESFYESVSALATVGLSLGVTSDLSVVAKLLVITYMYIGRVGLFTLTLGFLKTRDTNAIKYPSVKIMIG